jgi:hypothetical protein
MIAMPVAITRLAAKSALGHVWTAPWQGLSDVTAALVGCGHVSGLLMRQVWPLALMLCADRVPIVSAHFKSAMTQTGSPDPRIDLVCITLSCPRQFLQNFGTPSSLPGLTSLNCSGFDATSLWHFDAAEQAPSTASLTDMADALRNARFTPRSRHHRTSAARPLSADTVAKVGSRSSAVKIAQCSNLDGLFFESVVHIDT